MSIVVSYHQFGRKLRIPQLLIGKKRKAVQKLVRAANHECDACASKPGSPTLCGRCLALRAAYAELERLL